MVFKGISSYKVASPTYNEIITLSAFKQKHESETLDGTGIANTFESTTQLSRQRMSLDTALRHILLN